MTSVLYMLLGAALVAAGMLVPALADRVRSGGGKSGSRREAAPARATAIPTAIPVVEPATGLLAVKSPRVRGPAKADSATDVIAALVAAGYKKQVATEAAMGCSVADRATIEGWMAAALRRCARGGMS